MFKIHKIVSVSVNNHWKDKKLLYVFMFMLKPDSGRKDSKTEKLC
jgi:hypothetical protein